MDHFPFTHSYALLFWSNIFYIMNALFSVFTEIELFSHTLPSFSNCSSIQSCAATVVYSVMSQHLNGGKVFFFYYIENSVGINSHCNPLGAETQST